MPIHWKLEAALCVMIRVTGRFKTSHSWALFKTSHDIMQFVRLIRLYSRFQPGQRTG
jgi:hypothetical protein